jgi:hypothetical protein
MKGYVFAYAWKTKKEAEEYADTLRRSKHGIIKHKTYAGVKIIHTSKGYSVYAKESEYYKKWLRTGK